MKNTMFSHVGALNFKTYDMLAFEKFKESGLDLLFNIREASLSNQKIVLLFINATGIGFFTSLEEVYGNVINRISLQDPSAKIVAYVSFTTIADIAIPTRVFQDIAKTLSRFTDDGICEGIKGEILKISTDSHIEIINNCLTDMIIKNITEGGVDPTTIFTEDKSTFLSLIDSIDETTREGAVFKHASTEAIKELFYANRALYGQSLKPHLARVFSLPGMDREKFNIPTDKELSDEKLDSLCISLTAEKTILVSINACVMTDLFLAPSLIQAQQEQIESYDRALQASLMFMLPHIESFIGQIEDSKTALLVPQPKYFLFFNTPRSIIENIASLKIIKHKYS